ncbi:MAG: nucleotidyltransferase family protein [Chloroflexota bacterium]
MKPSINVPTRALVLAAGRGKRLRPYTDTTPKPLLPINGRPTLDFILESLTNAGVTNVAFVVHHLGEQIKTYVDDGTQWGITPTFFDQEEMLGTGHAVKTAASFLTEPAYLLAADYILPPNYLLDLRQKYLDTKTELAVSLKKLNPDEMIGRSSVRFGEDNLITEIVEKPAPGQAPSQIGASLIYILPPQIRQFINSLSLTQRGEYEIQQAINQMLRSGYTMCGLVQEPPEEWKPT